jgi:2-succinyl-5-enolpyruvyl-6-hydroxy-3-cyclohexene-1-carboxylate synthase
MTLTGATAATFSATLVDEWGRAGVTDAVVCPGSRSSPLALALERDARIRLWVRLDERSAGFFALGLGLESGRPAVVLTTSGTAAAELHAAVVEAHQARVPLICCTADRPPELHHVGAPQSIEQAELFRGAVRWFVDPGVPDDAARSSWRSVASRLVAEALHNPAGPGPVHANLPFRDPLVGEPGELPPGRAAGSSWHSVAERGLMQPSPEILTAVRPHLRPDRRGVIVAGAGAGEPSHVLAAAAALGWPILADPRSGCRVSEDSALGAIVVAAADGLLRVDSLRQQFQPEVVVRLGDLPASKVLAGWLASTAADGAVHVIADPWWSWKDPGREASLVVPARGDALLRGLEFDVEGPGDWARSWASAEAAAQRAIIAVLASHGEATEPFIARATYAAAEGSALVVSSSMPIRDVEWFAAPTAEGVRVLANRGANGIDGVVSTALGVAGSAGAGDRARPVFGLVGDLAVLHDASALVRSRGPHRATPAVIVVVDNDGGGIFSFLPQAASLEDATFERLFATPHEPAPAALIGACGYDVHEVKLAADVGGAIAAAATATNGSGLPSFVVVHTDRRANVAVHAEIEQAVATAVSEAR